jgi:hypothetical protein
VAFVPGGTAAPGPATISSLWDVPVTRSEAWRPYSPATFGVKFRSDVAGQVTGIRFWKASSSDTGPHTGLLYSSTGAVLAQATFTSETATGWQQVNFANPVSIAANTTYIAAYHSPSGFSLLTDYFYRQGVDAVPLHAPKYGVDGPNGLWSVGNTPAFPTQSRGNNYWVDLLFKQ